MGTHEAAEELPDRGPGPTAGWTYSEGGPGWVRRIVVAADGSIASAEGLVQVADLAIRLGAKVTVAYVRHLPATALMAPAAADPALIESLDEQESAVRQEVIRLVGRTGAGWEFVTRLGSPGDVKVADETGADLVVVGSNR